MCYSTFSLCRLSAWGSLIIYSYQCGRETNGLAEMSTSSLPEPVSKLPFTAKGKVAAGIKVANQLSLK